MAEVSNDELVRRLWALGLKPRHPELARETTALLCIDFQYLDAHPDHGFGQKAKALGIEDFMDDYWERLTQVVLPNVARLQAAARRHGVEVIHCHVATAKSDGRDNSRRFDKMDIGEPIHTKDAEFLPEVAPLPDEIVIRKVTSSPFNSTNIDRVLRNLGIKDLIVVGVVTNGCVESTVRSAAEHDYGVYLVEDGTAAVGRQLHDGSILHMSTVDAAITTTDEVLAKLERLGEPRGAGVAAAAG